MLKRQEILALADPRYASIVPDGPNVYYVSELDTAVDIESTVTTKAPSDYQRKRGYIPSTYPERTIRKFDSLTAAKGHGRSRLVTGWVTCNSNVSTVYVDEAVRDVAIGRERLPFESSRNVSPVAAFASGDSIRLSREVWEAVNRILKLRTSTPRRYYTRKERAAL